MPQARRISECHGEDAQWEDVGHPSGESRVKAKCRREREVRSQGIL